jgi:hypothetical protein
MDGHAFALNGFSTFGNENERDVLAHEEPARLRHHRRRRHRSRLHDRGVRVERRERIRHHLEAPLQGEAKTNFSGTIGSSLVEDFSPALITVALCKDPRQMRVRTCDPTRKPARRSFHVAAFRDQ